MTIVIFIGFWKRIDIMWMDKWMLGMFGWGFVFRWFGFSQRWMCRLRLRGRDDHETEK